MNLDYIRQAVNHFWQEKDVRWIIILSLLLPLLVLPGTSDPFGSIKVDLFYLLGGLSLVTFLPIKSHLNLFGKEKRYFAIGGLVFLFFALLSTIFSVDVFYSLRGYDFRYVHSLVYYLVWFAFIVRVAFLGQKAFRTVFWVLLFSTLLVAIQAYVDVIAGLHTGILYSWITVRPVGLLGNANFSSFFVSTLFIFCLWAEKYIARRYKLLWALTSLIIFGSLLLFMSRGNILGVIVGLLLYFGILFFRSKNKFSYKKIIFSVLSVLLISFILFEMLVVWRTNSFSNTGGLSDVNILNRVNLYDIAIDGFKHKPITGYGLGNFGFVYQSWIISHGYVDTSMNDDPHNYFLNLLVSGGAGLFLGFGLMLAASLRLLWVKSKGEEDGSLYLAGFISLIVWIINAQFNPIEVSGMFVLSILLALSLSGSRVVEISIKPTVLRLFGIICLIVASCFIAGDVFLNLGIRAYNDKNIVLANKYLYIGNFISPGTRMISALYTMTQIQAEPDSFAKAVNDYRYIHPKYGETNYWLGNFYMNKYLSTNDGKYLDQSINFFREAALDAPFSDSSVKYYAQSLIEKGNYDEAAMVVKQWVAKKPENFDAWNVLAKVYQRQKKFTQMEWALKQSYQSEPKQEYIANVLLQFKTRKNPEQVEYYIVNKVGRF